VPGVDTIEALTAAMRALDATPLGLQVDSDADTAVRQSLRRTGLVLLGEGHGVAQTPMLVEELITWFGLGGVALEWHEDLRPWLDCWITHGVLADPVWGDPAAEIWSGDGRLTAGHLAALRRWAAAGLLITLMDSTPVVRPRPGESPEESGRRWWSARDAAMADRVLAAPDAPGGQLVVAGDLHTRLEMLPADDPIGAEIGVPMGMVLARRRPGLCSIDCVYGPGGFYNLGPGAATWTACVGNTWTGPGDHATGRPPAAGAVASRGDSPAPQAAGSIIRVTLPASCSADCLCPPGAHRSSGWIRGQPF
jgi:hypothetical protein